MTSVATLPVMSSSVSQSTMQTTVSFSTSEFLSNFKELLSRNIVPCDELYSKLVEDNLLLPIMVMEIKALPTVEEKNSRLLDLLSVRGGNWLQRFSDILQLSGHTLLADTIRDEISGAPVTIVDGKEIFRRFPKLQKFLRDVEKQELTEYLIKRVREEALKQSWKKDVKAADKQKALVAKQMQLEEAIKHSEVLKDKDNAIERLHEEIARLENEVDSKTKELKNFTKNIDQRQGQQEKQLDMQMKFNIANDKQIRRLTDREIEGNKTLNQMIAAMENVLEQHQPKRPTSSYSRKMTGKSRSSAADSDWNISPLDTAKWTLDKVIKMIGKLATYKEKYDNLHQERLAIMKILGITADVAFQESVVDILASEMQSSHQQIQKLQKEVDDLLAKEIEKENEPPSGDEPSANLMENVETLQADVKLKETVIKSLKVENQKLRTQLGELKVKVSHQLQQNTEHRLTRAPTPFNIYAPAAESDSQVNVANIDAESNSSSDAPAVRFQVGAGRKPQPQPNINTQQGLHLPPLNKNADFRLTQTRNTGQTYGNRKTGPMKTTHSMTTGATQISRTTTPTRSMPNNHSYKPAPKKEQRILQISTFNPNNPNSSLYGIQKSSSKIQSNDLKRNGTFFR